MTTPAMRRPSRLSPEAVVIALLILGSGVGSLLMRQDANTDLHRYRFYIGYAFVHGRLDYDLVPAALGTFLNPILDSIHYLGIRHLPPRLFGFSIGALQGLNPALVFLITRRLIGRGSGSLTFALLVGVLAAAGPTARSLLGTTMGDTTASIPLLLSVLLVVGDDERPWRRPGSVPGLGAGLLAGASVGLKLTMAPFVLALAALIGLMVARRRLHVGGALAFFLGVVLGYAALAGYWCWLLWERFGNPLFPFANQIFRSPFLPPEAIRDTRWAAQGPLDIVATPLAMALGETSRLQEIPFRDARFLLVLIAGLVWLSMRWLGRRASLSVGQGNLLAYIALAYLAWLVAFYYYRYASVLEYLAPLALVILVRSLLPHAARTVLLPVGLFLLLSTSVGQWQRHAWGDRWWNITLPTQAVEPDTMVLLRSPLNSFLAPFFPERTRFVGLEWVGSSRFDDLVTAAIGSHPGSLMLLTSLGDPAGAVSLRRYGLAATEDCGIIRTGVGKKLLCRVVRLPELESRRGPQRM